MNQKEAERKSPDVRCTTCGIGTTLPGGYCTNSSCSKSPAGFEDVAVPPELFGPGPDAPAEQQASGAGFAQFLEGLRGAAATAQPFHVRFAVDLECSHPRELHAALRPLLERILKALEKG